ncbi:MAG: hypothetical protein M3Q05_10990, partial [Bacteroidota bacterium]|nr:hypothetical protein [Bacteroidota bacterium]
EKTLPAAANQEIDLQLKFGNNIKITAWDKPEVYVKVTYNINSGRLNDALLLDFNSGPDGPKVKVDFNQELLKTGRAEDCPDTQNGRNHSSYNGQSYFTCSQIDYEIRVPRANSLVVNTINGDIELRGLTGSVNAKSISGFVDMNWPDKKGATVSLKTITGEVYSDMDIAFTNKQKEIPMVGYQLKGNLNGGGNQVKLETISNNVYFRRGN